eukprot:scaffold30106_cov197-Isochrysis_galbana.AAC.2
MGRRGESAARRPHSGRRLCHPPATTGTPTCAIKVEDRLHTSSAPGRAASRSQAPKAPARAPLLPTRANGDLPPRVRRAPAALRPTPLPPNRSQRHPSLRTEDGGAAVTFSHRQPRGQPLRTPPNRAPPPPAAPPRPRRASAAPIGTLSSALKLWARLPPLTAANRAADRSGAPKSAALTSSSASAAPEVDSEPPPTIRSAAGHCHRAPAGWPGSQS